MAHRRNKSGDLQNHDDIADERRPLLDTEQNGTAEEEGSDEYDYVTVKFGNDDAEDPRQWTYQRKMTNVAIIALMAGEWRFFPKKGKYAGSVKMSCSAS